MNQDPNTASPLPLPSVPSAAPGPGGVEEALQSLTGATGQMARAAVKSQRLIYAVMLLARQSNCPCVQCQVARRAYNAMENEMAQDTQAILQEEGISGPSTYP